METDQDQVAGHDPNYLRFAIAYSRLGRAMYRMLSVNPAKLEEHRLETIEQTKQAWAICKRFGIKVDAVAGRRAA